MTLVGDEHRRHSREPSVKEPSRRRFNRNRVDLRVDVIVGSGAERQTLQGRAVTLSEGGMAAIVAGQLRLDDVVTTEFFTAEAKERLRAVVRHQSRLISGFGFINFDERERSMLRAITLPASRCLSRCDMAVAVRSSPSTITGSTFKTIFSRRSSKASTSRGVRPKSTSRTT